MLLTPEGICQWTVLIKSDTAKQHRKHLRTCQQEGTSKTSYISLCSSCLFCFCFLYSDFPVVLLCFCTSLYTSQFLSLVLTHWVTTQAEGLRCSLLIWLVKFRFQREQATLPVNYAACHTTPLATTRLAVRWLSSALCCKECKWVMTHVPCHQPEHVMESSSQVNLTPSTSHRERRNTTGTSKDLQSVEYYPRLRGNHFLTNRLSVTSWHSPPSSWHTNMASSKESAVNTKG